MKCGCILKFPPHETPAVGAIQLHLFTLLLLVMCFSIKLPLSSHVCLLHQKTLLPFYAVDSSFYLRP